MGSKKRRNSGKRQRPGLSGNPARRAEQLAEDERYFGDGGLGSQLWNSWATPVRCAEDPELSRLINHTSNVKHEVFTYAQEPPLLDALVESMKVGPGVVVTDATLQQALDGFVFQYRFEDGTTIIDSFLARHGDTLPDEDREVLLSWRNPVEGIFEVQDKDEHSALLLDLIGGREYRTYCTLGGRFFTQVQTGWFMQCRLLPLAGVWVISGAAVVNPAEHRRHMALKAQAAVEADPGAVPSARLTELLEHS